MLKSAYLFSKVGAATAENERDFLQKIGNYPTGPRRCLGSDRRRLRPRDGLLDGPAGYGRELCLS